MMNDTKPVTRVKFICKKECSSFFNGNVHKFIEGRVYIVLIKNTKNRFIYTNGNGPSSQFICAVDSEFIQENFKPRHKEEEEMLSQVDLLFENIFFNHG